MAQVSLTRLTDCEMFSARHMVCGMRARICLPARLVLRMKGSEARDGSREGWGRGGGRWEQWGGGRGRSL